MARKKKYRKSSKLKDRSAIINAIFDFTTNDLSYITNNEELLKEHAKFIRRTSYSTCSSLKKFTVPSGLSKGLYPKQFDYFSTRYKYIYERWVHMVRSCLDPDYPAYKYFGAKGIIVSRDFLDSKKFCIWCLVNGLTNKIGTYDKYLLRRKKTGNYSPVNCYVASEKEIHECRSLKEALNSLYIVKKYEEGHHKSVSYITAYTRYYVWDWQLEDAISTEYIPKAGYQYGFSPVNFYNSVADDKSCTQSVFLSRVHYSYINEGFICRPYDMLKPEYSIEEECAKQGAISYKAQWDRNRKEQENKQSVYSSTNDPIQDANNSNSYVTNVYNYNKELDVYSD